MRSSLILLWRKLNSFTSNSLIPLFPYQNHVAILIKPIHSHSADCSEQQETSILELLCRLFRQIKLYSPKENGFVSFLQTYFVSRTTSFQLPKI